MIIDKNFRNAPKEIVIGVIAHETVHIIRKSIRNKPDEIKKDERNTDILALRRGFAQELYELGLYEIGGLSKIEKEDYDHETGLSIKELEHYLKRMEKRK